MAFSRAQKRQSQCEGVHIRFPHCVQPKHMGSFLVVVLAFSLLVLRFGNMQVHTSLAYDPSMRLEKASFAVPKKAPSANGTVTVQGFEPGSTGARSVVAALCQISTSKAWHVQLAIVEVWRGPPDRHCRRALRQHQAGAARRSLQERGADGCPDRGRWVTWL